LAQGVNKIGQMDSTVLSSYPANLFITLALMKIQ